MSRTPNQNKAIAWYAEAHNLHPQLSAHPVYVFTNTLGDEVKIHIKLIVHRWEAWRKTNKKGKDQSGS